MQLGEPRFLTRYTKQATDWTIRDFIPGRGKIFFLNLLDEVWGPP